MNLTLNPVHLLWANGSDSVPVKEVFNGQTVWDEIVEVFRLDGHPRTNKAYAWLHDTGNPDKPKHVTVLHIDPALSPASAVRAFTNSGV